MSLRGALRSVVRGFLAGAVGTAAMTAYQLATRKVRGEPLGTPVPERWEDAPAPAQVAKRLAELTGQRLTKKQVPWVTQQLMKAEGPYVAVSDYMTSVSDMITVTRSSGKTVPSSRRIRISIGSMPSSA